MLGAVLETQVKSYVAWGVKSVVLGSQSRMHRKPPLVPKTTRLVHYKDQVERTVMTEVVLWSGEAI